MNDQTVDTAADRTTVTARNQLGRTLAALASNFTGLTDVELARRLLLAPSTCRARRRELVKLGLVEDSGRLRSGSGGVVWRVTAAGWDKAVNL